MKVSQLFTWVPRHLAIPVKTVSICFGLGLSASWFHAGTLYWSNWNWFLWWEQNRRTRRKPVGARREPTANSTHTAPGRNWTRATLVGGERSQHCAIRCYHNVWPRCMISKYNHVKFVHFVLLAVSEETKTWLPFFRSLYNKTIIKFGFAISRIFGFSVKIFSLSLRLRLITPTSTLIILDITKTSSNNYLLFIPRQ